MSAREDNNRRDGGAGNRLSWLATILGVVIAFLVINHKLVTGSVTGIWDAKVDFCADDLLVADHARDLRFMQWNPWINAGAPEGCEPQVGAFSPLTVGRVS